jgi:hypothetical protein
MKKILMAMAGTGGAARRRSSGPGQHHLFGAGRVVQHDCHGLCAYHRHQGQHDTKGSGEALAQLIAEKDNPKTDIWFGGTGDPHLQAAEQGLSLEYKSSRCRSCTPGRSSRPSSPSTAPWASTSGPLGFGYNNGAAGQEKAAKPPKVWADLLKPEYKGDVQWPTRHPAAPPTP